MPRDVGVVIAAAGSGARLGGELKQFRLIAGVPLLLRALRPFLSHPEVLSVVAVVPDEVASGPPKWLSDLTGERLQLVAGGAERSDSVRAGLAALPAGCATVLVHDGARPFASRDVIDRVIAAARKGTAAIAAVPVTDTLKDAVPLPDGTTVVTRTVPRAGLWRAQTPQGFPRAMIEQVHRSPLTSVTDDAQLVEHAGGTVVLIPDSALNLKVTTAEDLLLAEAIAGGIGRLAGQSGGTPVMAFRTEADLRRVLPIVQEHLRAGKVLAYPTETVYGLGSAPTDEGLEMLARLKGRSKEKPFLLLVSGREMAERWGLVFPPAASALAEAFWPGPLTLVLPGGEGRLPDMLRGPEGGIAVRHTGHSLVARLVAGLGQPLTSTSANRPRTPPAPGPEWIARIFPEETATGDLLILDGGALGNQPPSTVVDCTGPTPQLIREGALPRAELRRAVGRLAP